MNQDTPKDAVLEILKKIQADVAELKQARQEMREGFASIKSHMTGLIGDVFSHERRMLNIEDENYPSQKPTWPRGPSALKAHARRRRHNRHLREVPAFKIRES